MGAREMPPHPARAPRCALAHSPPSPERKSGLPDLRKIWCASRASPRCEGEGDRTRGAILHQIDQDPLLLAGRAPVRPIRGASA